MASKDQPPLRLWVTNLEGHTRTSGTAYYSSPMGILEDLLGYVSPPQSPPPKAKPRKDIDFTGRHHVFTIPYVEGVTDLALIKRTVLSGETSRKKRAPRDIVKLLVGIHPHETNRVVVYVHLSRDVHVTTPDYYGYLPGVEDIHTDSDALGLFREIRRSNPDGVVAHGYQFNDERKQGETRPSIREDREQPAREKYLGRMIRQIRRGETTWEELRDQAHPKDVGFVWSNRAILQEAAATYHEKNVSESRAEKLGVLIYKVASGEGYRDELTGEWITENNEPEGTRAWQLVEAKLKEKVTVKSTIPIGVDMDTESQHIYIWGDTRRGKSHWFVDEKQGLSREDPEKGLPGFHIYDCNSEKGWMADYTDSAHLVVMNEFNRRRMKPEHLKKWLEGTPWRHVEKKGGHVDKQVNHPTIIIAQCSPWKMFNPGGKGGIPQEDFDAIMSRLIVVHQQGFSRAHPPKWIPLTEDKVPTVIQVAYKTRKWDAEVKLVHRPLDFYAPKTLLLAGKKRKSPPIVAKPSPHPSSKRRKKISTTVEEKRKVTSTHFEGSASSQPDDPEEEEDEAMHVIIEEVEERREKTPPMPTNESSLDDKLNYAQCKSRGCWNKNNKSIV